MQPSDLTLASTIGDRIPLVVSATGAKIRTTIVGASTLTVDLPDSALTDRLDTITHALAAGRSWRFVAVKALGEIDRIRLIFEDDLINRLRRDRGRVMYQVALPVEKIIRGFCSEAGVPVAVDPLLGETYVEGAGRSLLEVTDSWREIGALVDRLGGRVFSTGETLIASTDAAMLAADPVRVRSAAGSLTSKISFTIDEALPHDRASFHVDERWTAEAGAVVDITGSGPADGRWLVETYTRDLPARAATGTVRLVRPHQEGL